MRCAECQREVEAYFDGELDEQTHHLVAQHLSACASCATLYRKLEGEQELYLRYECDAEPAPAFWDNVMSRAAQENPAQSARPLSRLRGWLGNALGNFNAPRLSPSLTALMVLIAIGITIGVMRFVNQRAEQSAPVSLSLNKDVPPVTVAAPLPDEVVTPSNSSRDDETGGKEDNRVDGQPQLVKNRVGRKDKNLLVVASNENAGRAILKPSARGRKPTSDELVREAEQKYVAAIALLSKDVNRRRSRLDPQTAARFAQTLAAVDRSIADTRRAARKHPGDPVAAQYMLTAYSRKVSVLREMVSY
jgi:Putative zinc-finger